MRLTPNLDALAARGASFDSAYAASSFTLPSLHTLATGEPPPVHRVRFWTHFGNRFRGPTLAERFREEGLATGFFHSGYVQLATWPILNRGWDGTQCLVQADAGPVLDSARAWLDTVKGRRFFLWVHLFEPHTPYAPQERFAEGLADLELYRQAGPATFPVTDWIPKVAGARGPWLADRLHAADVRQADDAAGRLLADLDARGLTANTVVCVVSDHGENLSGDPEPRWDHGTSTDIQLIHVPMLLAGPGVPAGKRDTAPASHLDIPPTLLRAAGFDPPRDWMGRDLLGAAAPPRHVIAEATVSTAKDAPFYSVTDGRLSLRIFTDTAPPHVELRDETAPGAPATRVDPSEPFPAAAPFVETWTRYAARCADRAALLNEPGADAQDLTDEQREMLRVGGYLR